MTCKMFHFGSCQNSLPTVWGQKVRGCYWSQGGFIFKNQRQMNSEAVEPGTVLLETPSICGIIKKKTQKKQTKQYEVLVFNRPFKYMSLYFVYLTVC